MVARKVRRGKARSVRRTALTPRETMDEILKKNIYAPGKYAKISKEPSEE
jgi:hypothetical protein